MLLHPAFARPCTCTFSWQILDFSIHSFLSHSTIHWGMVFNKAISILDPPGVRHVVWSGLYLCCKLSSCYSPTANTVLQDFRKTNFHLFKVPCKTSLRGKRAEQSWQIFSEVFHGAQELAIPRSEKLVKGNERSVWQSWELLVKLKGKKQMHGHGNKDR